VNLRKPSWSFEVICFAPLYFEFNFQPGIYMSGHQRSLKIASCEIEWFLCISLFQLFTLPEDLFLLKKILHPFKCLATSPMSGLLTFKPKHLENIKSMMCTIFYLFYIDCIRDFIFTSLPSTIFQRTETHVTDVIYCGWIYVDSLG
jgi:hypothetical protein